MMGSGIMVIGVIGTMAISEYFSFNEKEYLTSISETFTYEDKAWIVLQVPLIFAKC